MSNSLLSKSSEIVSMVVQRLEDKSGPLGLNYVGKYGEVRLIEYPAVVVLPIHKEKVVHATNTFNLNLTLHLFVYHSDLTESKRERSESDVQLAERIEAELESDYGWQIDPTNPDDDRRIIFGYVSEEEFGILQPRANKSNAVISTRLTWRALTQRRFT